MSTKHRNAGGPFVIYDPGIGVSGSLSVDGTVQGTNDGLQINSDLHVTGTISASTSLTGDLTGNADTATTATNINIASDVTNLDRDITFVAGNGTQRVGIDGGQNLKYNPSTNTLTAPNFSGNLTGNADTATALATGRTLKVDLTSTSVSTAFDGSASLTDIGVNGTLQVGNGGTGLTSIATLLNSNVTKSSLGLVIGTDIQAYDANLAAIAGLTSAADKGIQFTGSGTAATYDLTSAGKALLDDVDAAAQRTTLGLGSLATQGRIDTTDFTSNSLVTESEGIAANDNDTSVPTSAAVKAYVDANAGGSSFTYLEEAATPSNNSKILIANNAGTFPSPTVKEASLVIKSNTNISQPSQYGGAAIAIHDVDSNAGWQIYYATNSNNLMFTPDGGSNQYQMLGSIGSGTVTISTSFTGQHRCLSSHGLLEDYFDRTGLIVESTGEYRNFESDEIINKPTINQAIPKIKLSETRNSKKAFGVVSGIEGEKREIDGSISLSLAIPESDRRVLVNSIGEGGIWICNINGNLENGDYITSCEVPGLGMKQDDDLLHNYTVAKITCDCNFDLDSTIYDCEEFEFNGSTYKKAFVGCTYHCG